MHAPESRSSSNRRVGLAISREAGDGQPAFIVFSYRVFTGDAGFSGGSMPDTTNSRSRTSSTSTSSSSPASQRPAGASTSHLPTGTTARPAGGPNGGGGVRPRPGAGPGGVPLAAPARHGPVALVVVPAALVAAPVAARVPAALAVGPVVGGPAAMARAVAAEVGRMAAAMAMDHQRPRHARRQPPSSRAGRSRFRRKSSSKTWRNAQRLGQ